MGTNVKRSAQRWPGSVVARVSAEVQKSSLCTEALRRVEAGASQRSVAQALGVMPNTVSAWVRRADELARAQAVHGASDVPLTEEEIAAMRAKIARAAADDGDYRTALDAMRDEAKRQRLEADLQRSETVTLVAELASVPRERRRAELRERAARLGITVPEPSTDGPVGERLCAHTPGQRSPGEREASQTPRVPSQEPTQNHTSSPRHAKISAEPVPQAPATSDSREGGPADAGEDGA